ncbi:hypothetical protein CALCODRAFT_492161, partial [Calocera cornea HHB12733]
MICLTTRTDAYAGAIQQPCLSVCSLLASRMFLNLRESIYRWKDAEAHEDRISTEETSEGQTVQFTIAPSSQAARASTSWGT